MNDLISNAIITEYNALRTELRDKQKTQFTILSMIVTAVSVVFGLTANLKLDYAEASLPVLYFFLLPSTIMFWEYSGSIRYIVKL